ncbi:MAG: peptidoglycan-binding protein [Polyangiaceae bacterium]|nr:peptidoglycan-binding protein [Polyangiaceae bacterium]
MPKKLTAFERMWNAYPAPGGSTDEAKKMIGGDVDAAWITNTCVVRVSRSFNYAGHLLPQGFPGFSTVRGGDGLRYGFRVEEFRKYLAYVYGPAPIVAERPTPSEEVPPNFLGQTGVICFRVKGWSDATGHFDLWDGAACRHHEYFGKAYQILLWRVTSSGEPKLAPGTSPVPLSGSVGQGGKNKKEDVARVQALLDARGFEIGPADGLVGPRTIEAIFDFQRRFLAVADGRVDPNGRTWRELNGL